METNYLTFDDNQLNMRHSFLCACIKGDMKAVLFYIHCTSIYYLPLNTGLICALKFNHINIVDAILEVMWYHCTLNWKYLILVCAKEISYIVNRAETIPVLPDRNYNKIDSALYHYSIRNDKNTVIFLLENGANIDRLSSKTVLDVNDIYYLLQKGIRKFPKEYIYTLKKCHKKYKEEYMKMIPEIINVKEMVNIIGEY